MKAVVLEAVHQQPWDASGERILQHQIVERFVRRSRGELEPLTAGSTKPVAETVTHAGIARVLRYSFAMM
jgi:hypothetical protein